VVTLDGTRWYALRRSTDPPHRPPTTFEPRKLKRNVVTVGAE
jgi:hypothetical protein